MTDKTYATMNHRTVEKMPKELSIAANAMDAFRLSGGPIEAHDPERAKALLEKVLGENSKYAWLKRNHEFHPVFEVDGIELAFTQGVTQEEDQLTAIYLGIKSPVPIRSKNALGMALYICLTECDEYTIFEDVVADAYFALDDLAMGIC